jgi:hypothetical protein
VDFAYALHIVRSRCTQEEVSWHSTAVYLTIARREASMAVVPFQDDGPGVNLRP